MIQTQRFTVALTPLDAALRLLLDGVTQVDPIDVAIEDAIGRVAAEMPPLTAGLPDFNVAISDGWALRSRDLVGASSYSPLNLTMAPPWVEAGERMPDGCDCVLDSDLAEQTGALFQALGEVTPGHGVRRAGKDLAAGHSLVSAGQRIDAIALLAVLAAGLDRLQVRSPRVRIIDVPSRVGSTASMQFLCEFAKAAGARVSQSIASGRDAVSISAAVGGNSCDLWVIVGGTGIGRTDAATCALKSSGALLAHGLAMLPGRSTAVGRIGDAPVILVPRAPDQALAACLLLLQPALDRLTGRVPRTSTTRPLIRKISSAIGVAELVLLKVSEGGWMPLAIAHLSLDAIVSADAWLVVPSDSEGFAAGTPVEALTLHEGL